MGISLLYRYIRSKIANGSSGSSGSSGSRDLVEGKALGERRSSPRNFLPPIDSSVIWDTYDYLPSIASAIKRRAFGLNDWLLSGLNHKFGEHVAGIVYRRAT